MKELDCVKLLSDALAQDVSTKEHITLSAGRIGTIVSVLKENEWYTVEFLRIDDSGYTEALEDLPINCLELLP